MTNLTEITPRNLTITTTDFGISWTANGFPASPYKLNTLDVRDTPNEVGTVQSYDIDYVRSIAEALRHDDDIALLHTAMPEVAVCYSWDHCEMCGTNTEEVEWKFHGPNSVTYSARYGCYGGHAQTEPVTLKEAVDQLPPLGGTHLVSMFAYDEEDGDEDVSEGPELTVEHLESLWEPLPGLVKQLRTLNPDVLDSWADNLATIQTP